MTRLVEGQREEGFPMSYRSPSLLGCASTSVTSLRVCLGGKTPRGAFTVNAKNDGAEFWEAGDPVETGNYGCTLCVDLLCNLGQASFSSPSSYFFIC